MPDPQFSKTKLTFDIDESLLKAAQMKAAEEDTSLEQVIEEGLTAYLQEALPDMGLPVTDPPASGMSGR
jgi:predicted HicB family RNase H-like nuclease